MRSTSILPFVALALLLAGATHTPAAAQVAFAAERAAATGATPSAVAAANDPTDAFVPGFTSWFVSTLDREVEAVLARGAAPGAVVVIGHGGGVVLSRAWGRTDWATGAPAASATTLYDLASVTKVAATTLAVMILVEEGRLDLDAPLATYLGSWPVEGERSRVTLRHLLTHRSGLPAGAPFWRRADGFDARVAALAALPPEYPTGERELYSDLGPILAGFVVESVTGESLDRFVERRVYLPLGMGQTTFRPADRAVPLEAVAPTERIGDLHLHGVVHDPSARALDGVAGNAGLFSSAGDLAILASALLWERPRRLVCRDLLRDFTRRGGGRSDFGVGWESSRSAHLWRNTLSDQAFGHTGFTGTSLWIDPGNDLFVILLTNRINPTAANDLHHDLRYAVHSVLERAHAGEERERRARDWRWIDDWSGPDGCRAERGVELLRRLGNGVLAGWASIPGR